MAAFYDATHHLVISGDEARGGVTGHNVRYVLAISMTGVIAAFAVIGLYWGYDSLQQSLVAAFARSPAEVLRNLVPYAAIFLAGVIAGGLALGIWNLIGGRSEDDSESFMRARVATQFALVCVIMALLYVSTV